MDVIEQSPAASATFLFFVFNFILSLLLATWIIEVCYLEDSGSHNS